MADLLKFHHDLALVMVVDGSQEYYWELIIVPSFLAMDCIYEFLLRFGWSFSVNKRSRHMSSPNEQPFCVIDENSMSARS